MRGTLVDLVLQVRLFLVNELRKFGGVVAKIGIYNTFL